MLAGTVDVVEPIVALHLIAALGYKVDLIRDVKLSRSGIWTMKLNL